MATTMAGRTTTIPRARRCFELVKKISTGRWTTKSPNVLKAARRRGAAIRSAGTLATTGHHDARRRRNAVARMGLASTGMQWARLYSTDTIGGIPQLEPDAFHSLLESSSSSSGGNSDPSSSGTSIVVLDVREPHEWAGELGVIEPSKDMKSVLPTLYIPLGELPNRWPAALEALKDTVNDDSTIHVVAVCKVGVRSQIASTVLVSENAQEEYDDSGITLKVSNLRGGMQEWSARFGMTPPASSAV